jgi:hypothetical protein
MHFELQIKLPFVIHNKTNNWLHKHKATCLVFGMVMLN